MNERIQQLLGQIAHLEDELRSTLAEEEHRVLFTIRGKRVQFEQAVRQRHRQLKVGVLRWLSQSQLGAVLSVPFIYSVIVPLALLDLWVTAYQWICFPLYRIARVRRADYIVFDRHDLGYLNAIEKFNCLYCSYGNGVIAYAREVASRTEQYWCPIKHAHKVLGTHARYAQFLPYGDATDYPLRLQALRDALSADRDPTRTCPNPSSEASKD